MSQITDSSLLSQLNQPSGRVTDPALLAQLNGAGATAADRVDALEGGILGGGAYLGASPVDTALNVGELGKAGLGTAYGLTHTSKTQSPSRTAGALYHFISPEGLETYSHNPPPPGSKPVTYSHTEIPHSLQVESGPNPVGQWLTQQMDKSDLLHTNVRHPEDAASRWLHTAGGVIPGAAAGGGGTVRGTLQALAGGESGAAAAQGVHEWHPFTSPTSQALAEAGAGALGSMAGSSLVPGTPMRTPQNQAIMEGQEAGYHFPAATTNPTHFNKLMARIAGGATVQDEAQLHNQPLTNAGVRQDLQLPGEGPLTPTEREQIRTQTNADYRAVADSGARFQRDAPLIRALQNAKSRYTNTSALSPSLASSPAATRIDELMGITQPGGKPRLGTTFSAKDGVATVESLRDAARTAARNGEMGDSTAYRNAATAIEQSMDRALPPNLVDAWRAARVRRAQLHTAEEAMSPNGDVDATKLGKMYAEGEPLSGNMALTARSANAAWRGPASKSAFSVPQTVPTGGHGGFWGPLTGAVVGGEGAAHLGETIGGLFGHPEAGAVAGAAPLAAYGSYVASRAAARRLALAQLLARQRQAPNVAGGLGAAYTGTLATVPP